VSGKKTASNLIFRMENSEGYRKFMGKAAA